MSASTAIGRVSDSLRELLLGEMNLDPKVAVTVLAPDESATDRRINLFLYKIRDNPHLNQGNWQVKPGSSSQLVPPPLSLNLYYLMTPYALNDEVRGNAAAHEILGEAMRVFAEFPVVPNEYLEGDLTMSREEIRIMLNGLDMEELSQIWSTFGEPFRLSVLYEVSAVQLDLSPASERTVAQRPWEITTPEVGAAYRPPVVERIEPTRGPAGTTVTFYGSHLDGWRVYVRLLRKEMVSVPKISGDTFQAELPSDLEAGFYELRVDVSNVFRRNFLFEVPRPEEE